MMKRKLFAIVLSMGLFVCTNSNAQLLKKNGNLNFNPKQEYGFQKLGGQLNFVDIQTKPQSLVNQTESTQSRLKGYSYKVYDGVQYKALDSMEFFWGTGNNNTNTVIHSVLESTPDAEILYFPTDFDYNLHEESFFIHRTEYFININSDSVSVFLELGSGLENTNYFLNSFSNGLKDKTEIYIINGNEWDAFSKLAKFYDNQGNLIEERAQLLSNGIWENDRAIIYEYNNNGSITLIKFAEWDMINNEWEYLREMRGEYDNQNRLERTVLKEMNNGNLENSEREIFFYNSNGTVDYIQKQMWIGNMWVNDMKKEFTYNSSNLTNKVIKSSYINDEWVELIRKTYNYNSNGDYTEIIFEVNQFDVWDYIGKIEREYNGDALKKVTLLEWSNAESTLVNNLRTHYETNSYNQFTKVYSEVWDNDSWKIINDAPLFNFYYEEYEAPVSIDEIENDFISTIYPNPTKDQLTIKSEGVNLEKISIINLQGSVVYETKNTIRAKEVQLDISHLNAGMYYVILKNEKGQVTKSIQKL